MNARHTILPVIAALALGVVMVDHAQAGKPPSGDKTPPAPVTDLVVVPGTTTHRSVTLRWTAPGDDGTKGTAASYDIRYRIGAPVTEANWATATQAFDEPAPQRAGSVQSMLVGGLSELSNYYCAMKVADKAGNVSALSNNANATTLVTPAGGWAIETASARLGAYRTLDIDAAGHVGIGLMTTAGVWVTLWNGSAWVDESVDQYSGHDGVAFAFAPDGVPSVSYGYGDLHFATRPGAQWTIETVGSPAAASETSLAYDPSGPYGSPEPTIAYPGGSMMRFARKSAGTWTTQMVDPVSSRYPSLAYDANTEPGIAYAADTDSNSSLDSLKFARWNAGTSSWDGLDSTPGADVVDTSGLFAALAYNPVSGHPAIAYTNWGLGYASWNGSAWQAQLVDTNEVHGTSLTFDAAGTPFVSYLSDGVGVRVASYTGGTWHIETVDVYRSYLGGHTHIAVDPVTGRPAMSYVGAGTMVARKRP